MKAKLVEESLYSYDYKSEAINFMRKMSDLEYKLFNINARQWHTFKKESEEFWEKINAESWAEAFKKDEKRCMSFKEQLQNMLK